MHRLHDVPRGEPLQAHAPVGPEPAHAPAGAGLAHGGGHQDLVAPGRGADARRHDDVASVEIPVELSNPQIAQSLFLSLKTVEMHLGRTYRKLDIAGRAELKAQLGAPAHSAPEPLAT